MLINHRPISNGGYEYFDFMEGLVSSDKFEKGSFLERNELRRMYPLER